jgi:diguanylate cyclase (GGDEF)-like protein
MGSRYRALIVYSLLLAAVTGVWLTRALIAEHELPPAWAIALCIAVCLFIWQFGLRAPRIGLISMERVPQIGLLLVLSPSVAAAICATASLLWPWLNRGYSQGSMKVAALRSLHNAPMTALMLLAAGHAYQVAGGRHPLADLAAGDIWPLIVMAIVAQVVNLALMALFFQFDGRDVRRIMTPVYALTDLVFVPAGILAAVLYNSGQYAAFALFSVLMVVFVLSVNSIGGESPSDENDRAPLLRLFEARRALHGARRIDALGERILTETRALFRFDEFYFALIDRDHRQLDIRVHERRETRMPWRTKPMDTGLFGWVTERAEPLLIEDWTQTDEGLRRRTEVTEKETGSLIIVPLIESGIVIGLLSVQHTEPGVYSNADLHLMRQLAEQVAAAVADARAFEDLEDYRRRLEERVAERTSDLEKANWDKERLIAALRERSTRLERETQEDPLTGVANRRLFSQRLAAEMEVALAVGQPLTIAVADLDHFKIVNDQLGHAVGDLALRESAALLQRLCRENDLVARIGGEEFALILPGLTRESGVEFCENLRQRVEAHDWHAVHQELAVTISIGLSQWDGSAEVAELLKAADIQLYRAKRAGRNQVA